MAWIDSRAFGYRTATDEKNPGRSIRIDRAGKWELNET
jgi:hypothetical protein